jgi:cell division FtsZ-interacting protein ZapD
LKQRIKPSIKIDHALHIGATEHFDQRIITLIIAFTDRVASLDVLGFDSELVGQLAKRSDTLGNMRSRQAIDGGDDLFDHPGVSQHVFKGRTEDIGETELEILIALIKCR